MEIKMEKCTIKTQAEATIDMASITLKQIPILEEQSA